MLKPSVKGSEAAAGSCNGTRDFAYWWPSFCGAERGCCDAWLCLAGSTGNVDFFQPKSREKSSPGWLPLLTTWNMWRMHWPKLGILSKARSCQPVTMICPSQVSGTNSCHWHTGTVAHLHTYSTHQTSSDSVSSSLQCKNPPAFHVKCVHRKKNNASCLC